MKRSAFLQPLSREHHTALSLARRCERAAASGDAALVDEACREAVDALAQDLKLHFETEERSLLPLLQDAAQQPAVERTLADHRHLHGLLDGLQRNDVATLDAFGKSLAAHVRFEERELFPAIETLL
ncbi:MAG: hemerythrin domain-containing protein [Gammaproteobacteria bacterium]